MKKKYYVTSFIHGVVFTSMKQLREYYINATKKINGKRKPEEVNCGDVKTFSSERDLSSYMTTTEPLCKWKLHTN